MITVKVEEEMERIRFADRAARYFALHHDMAAYSDNDIAHGCFLALRGGVDNNCVMVVKLDAHFEPTNYQNIIRAKRMDSREGES
jgi:hypothetical protein